jgi:hypothetical protein
MNKYRLILWVIRKRWEITARRHLSAFFAVVLAIWTLILEWPHLAHWPPTIELSVALLTLGTILAAAWEMAGNKLELSLEQERFLTAIGVLFNELGKFGYGKDKEPDLNQRLDNFVDAFLEITSHTLLGKNYVQAALAFETPGGNEFSVVRT